MLDLRFLLILRAQKSMAKLYKIFLVLFLYSLLGKAQETIVVEGWKYIPQNQELYDQIAELTKNKNYYEALSLSFKVLNDKKTETLAKVEAKLFLAQTLLDLDLKVTAIEYLKEIVKDNPGSFMAQQALVELSKNVPLTPVYWKDLSALLNRGAFKEVPAPAEPMIQYFVTLDNFSKNEYRWGFESYKKIKNDNFWGQNLEYFNALEKVKNNNLKGAEEELNQLIDRESTHPVVKKNAILQRARIYFELKEYDKAEQEYLKYDTRGRETGRVLYERALASFYQKKYAFALGLLESIKSENFKTSFNPEQVILEMMIYRELCHYPTVKKIAGEFESKYKFLISYFKSGQDLTKSQVLKKIIFQNIRYKDSADLVNQIRVEIREIKTKHSAMDSAIAKKIISDIEKSEKLYMEAIEREIKPLLKPAAVTFMAKSEEIRLLEYVSGLDEYRIKNIFESREYKSQNAEREKSYNTLYWPVEKEYWSDEFKNYQVLLVDRCNGAAVKKEEGK